MGPYMNAHTSSKALEIHPFPSLNGLTMTSSYSSQLWWLCCPSQAACLLCAYVRWGNGNVIILVLQSASDY